MENIKKSKAVIYCRVSTKEQAEEGNSLATQERNCREYASKYGYEISQVFIEEGESAKTADRTELQKLLRFCADKKQDVKAVIIYKIDRLSRNTDDYSQLRLLLKRYGVEIKSTSEYFENTPAGRFMENIIANVAQFDNDVRTERSVGGMRDAVREGRYVWMAPVGYKNEKVDGKANIIQSDKAGFVYKAFEMMADRTDSIDNIRKTLATMGLSVTKSHFYKMLKNELYAGWICKFGERHKGTFEPIISETLFNRVQQVMKNKKTPSLYVKNHPDFPLRRFVLNDLGNKLTGAWSQGRNKKYPYYRFIETRQQWRKNDIEEAFASFMDTYAFNETSINRLKAVILSRFSQNDEIKVKNMEILTTQKQQLKDRQNTLLQKNINGVISDKLLKEQLLLLDEEIWKIDKQLQQKNESKVNVRKILDFVSEFLQYPSATWMKMPYEIRIKLQWFQFPKGVVIRENEFRTAEISSLFKLKRLFSTSVSSNVHYPGLNYEHEYSANFSDLQIDKNVFWDEILSELGAIEAIIHDPIQS